MTTTVRVSSIVTLLVIMHVGVAYKLFFFNVASLFCYYLLKRSNETVTTLSQSIKSSQKPSQKNVGSKLFIVYDFHFFKFSLNGLIFY